MKPQTAIAILLIVGGLFALAYQGINYTTQEKAIDIGPLQVMTERSHTIPLPPLVGIALLIGGIVLLVVGFKKTDV